jgi:ABC-2 type transport system permease protein
MGKLLKVEWMKIKNYRTFWILSILFIISIVGINYVVYQIKQSAVQSNKSMEMFMGAPYNFPNVWHTVSYFSSLVMLLPGLMIITSVANEFTFRTHRQNIIDGWSRSQFIHVKILLVFILAVISTIVVGITAYCFGYTTETAVSFKKIEFVGYYFIQAISYGMLALLLSVLIKRSGLAIGIYFLYSFIIENAAGALINRRIYHSFYGPGDYLPLNATDSLIPFPFFRNIVNLGTPPSLYLLLGLSAAYLVVYYIVAVNKFMTDDL